MKEWNGLLKKEWVTMRGQLFAIITASIMFIIVIPFSSNLFNLSLDSLGLSIIMGLIWMVVSMFIPAIMLLISLSKEMRRPDIWLHSEASIFKLFSVKAVYAIVVSAVSLAIPVVVLIVEARYLTYPLELSLKMALQVGSLLFVLFYIFSILFMCSALFFGVIYQLIKPKIFAIPIVLILFLISSWIMQWITATKIYVELTSFWAIEGPSKSFLEFGKENSFIEIDTTTFYAGDFLLGVLFSVLLFITAVVIFDKKVKI